MERAEFILAIAAGFFSVFLLAWHGYDGYSSDWIYGFLAVFWSLLMMMRLMTLTTPAQVVEASGHLAQKLVRSFRETQERTRQNILETSFGGSFVLFIGGLGVFAAWQIFCAAFPSQNSAMDGVGMLMRQFFGEQSHLLSITQTRVFDWGQGFLLLLSLSMMGFVLRSHAGQRKATRSVLLILCAYAVSGYIALTGLEGAGHGGALAGVDLVGNGAGALSYLRGTIEPDTTLSLFDILLLESGIGGIAILTFILFVPLGHISLCVQNSGPDLMVLVCGMITGAVMILSVFLAFTPALGGLMALCWMSLFLAWGASENNLQIIQA